MNGNMARVCVGKVSVLRKSVDILRCIETLPVIYCRYSSCDTSQRSWEPVEKETHTGQVCYVHFFSSCIPQVQVSTTVNVRMVVFWVVTSCSWIQEFRTNM
jgi:hypothetical protein